MTKNKCFVSQSFNFNFNNNKKKWGETREKKNVSSDYFMGRNQQIRRWDRSRIMLFDLCQFGLQILQSFALHSVLGLPDLDWLKAVVSESSDHIIFLWFF